MAEKGREGCCTPVPRRRIPRAAPAAAMRTTPPGFSMSSAQFSIRAAMKDDRGSSHSRTTFLGLECG